MPAQRRMPGSDARRYRLPRRWRRPRRCPPPRRSPRARRWCRPARPRMRAPGLESAWWPKRAPVPPCRSAPQAPAGGTRHRRGECDGGRTARRLERRLRRRSPASGPAARSCRRCRAGARRRASRAAARPVPARGRAGRKPGRASSARSAPRDRRSVQCASSSRSRSVAVSRACAKYRRIRIATAMIDAKPTSVPTESMNLWIDRGERDGDHVERPSLRRGPGTGGRAGARTLRVELRNVLGERGGVALQHQQIDVIEGLLDPGRVEPARARRG